MNLSTYRRATIALVLLAALAAVLSACSSPAATQPAAVTSSSSTTSAQSRTTTTTTAPAVQVKEDPVDTAFKVKVDAVCAAWVADGIKHQPPFYMGNPLAITQDQLPQAATYLDSLSVNHDLVKNTSDVGTPNMGKDAWSTLRADFEAFQKAETAAIAAAKASDLAAWTTQASAAEKARDAILNDLHTAGFHGRDPCQDVFVRGAFHG
jgi:hypothetical protein